MSRRDSSPRTRITAASRGVCRATRTAPWSRRQRSTRPLPPGSRSGARSLLRQVSLLTQCFAVHDNYKNKTKIDRAWCHRFSVAYPHRVWQRFTPATPKLLAMPRWWAPDQTFKSLRELQIEYDNTVGHNANLLLGVTRQCRYCRSAALPPCHSSRCQHFKSTETPQV